MIILPVTDPSFQNYGQILTGYDLKEVLTTLGAVAPVPDGVTYVPEEPELMALGAARELSVRAFGGMPIQLGYCSGHNTKLNCLEYHRDSELNVGTGDFILLLAKREEMVDGRLDTGKVVAYRVPAGVLVEVYATTLHYAPCCARAGEGFQVLVVLPRFTNTDKPDFVPACDEDRILTARNKWLLAHAESSEAKGGAEVRLDGVNIDIGELI